MKLLTEELMKKFAKIGSQQDVEDPIIIARYFVCIANWDFYATEFDPQTNMFTGIFKWLVTEWGTIRLEDLKSMRGPGGLKVERNRFFKSCRMSELGLK